MAYIQPNAGEITEQHALDLADCPDSVVLLDVRERNEWDDGHIEGAIHFPLSSIQHGQMPDISQDRNIVIYCKGGFRSMQAAMIMQQRGYSYLTNMAGGFDSWPA